MEKKEIPKASISFNVLHLADEAKDAMRVLGVQSRDSLTLDGKLLTIIVDTILGRTDFTAIFYAGEMMAVNGDIATRVYPNPSIKILKNVDSILSGFRESSKVNKCLAKSVVCHELTHYFQKTFAEESADVRTLDRKVYVSTPAEKEAFAVQSYIFWKCFDPDLLKNLMNHKSIKTKEDRWEVLIDFFEQSSSPNGKAIFNKFIVK